MSKSQELDHPGSGRSMVKLEALTGSEWSSWHYSDTYELEKTSGPARLVIGPSASHPELLLALTQLLRPPLALLYVLHTPRVAKIGSRFQSPPLTHRGVEAFLEEYSPFLGQDGRHDLWVRSLPDAATLVWDRHEIIFAYGPLELYEAVLGDRGFRRGAVRVPTPHRHNYHDAWDAAEQSLLDAFDWIRSPLCPQDEQALDDE